MFTGGNVSCSFPNGHGHLKKVHKASSDLRCKGNMLRGGLKLHSLHCLVPPKHVLPWKLMDIRSGVWVSQGTGGDFWDHEQAWCKMDGQSGIWVTCWDVSWSSDRRLFPFSTVSTQAPLLSYCLMSPSPNSSWQHEAMREQSYSQQGAVDVASLNLYIWTNSILSWKIRSSTHCLLMRRLNSFELFLWLWDQISDSSEIRGK